MEKIKKLYCSKYWLFILGILIPLLIEKFCFPNESLSIDRFIIFAIIIWFIIANFIFDYKKIWEFIFKHRYLVGIILFCYIVLNGYHTSSLGVYNDIVEPNNKIESGVPILGSERSIRSDEWLVGSMHILSQATSSNKYGIYNKSMMATKTPVNFYPKLPTKDLSIITKPEYLGFCFLPLEQAFSFYCYFILFFTFFATFEFILFITNNNRIWSFAGALLIACSPGIQWWDQEILVPVGFTAILLINKFINEKRYSKKILYALLVGWLGSIFFMKLYPAFMIPYFYFYLGILIWLLIVNKGKYNFKDIILLLICIFFVMAVLIIPAFLQSKEIFSLMSNTVYPGARFSVGGYAWQKLFNYVLSIFLPYIHFSNSSEAAQYLSFYPIPLMIGIRQIIVNKKNKNKDYLLIIMVAVCLLLNIWNYITLPDCIAKYSLLYMSTPDRCQLIVGYICTIILVYCMAMYKNKIKKDKFYILGLSFFIAIFAISINYIEYSAEISKKVIILSIFIFSALNYFALYNTKKNSNIFAIILCILSITSGLTIHPVSKGLGVIYDKPVAKEIRKIVANDKEAIWVFSGDSLMFSNYVLANGAKILNSTNYYPNVEMWKKIDSKKKYEEIWNRYAHMIIVLTNEPTYAEIVQADVIKVYLNIKSICDLNIRYMLSNNDDLEIYSNNNLLIEKIYKNDNLYIYRNTCSL